MIIMITAHPKLGNFQFIVAAAGIWNGTSELILFFYQQKKKHTRTNTHKQQMMMLHTFINPEKKWQRRIKLVSILEENFLSIIHDISVHLTTKSENKKRWLSFHPSLQIYNCVVPIYISKIYKLFFSRIIWVSLIWIDTLNTYF